MKYRRAKQSGGCYFFTVVTNNRAPYFQNPKAVNVLRQGFKNVIAKYPFTINAIVILPDHIHTIWTLPKGDCDFSLRWRMIKTYVTKHANSHVPSLWQKRFWEHLIKDEKDYQNHVEYIHYNPVKHGYVRSPKEWANSSFKHFVTNGIYPENWGSGDVVFSDDVGYE